MIADPKEDSFTKINPNGRLPAIEDPNTNLTLWESGAIVEYLVENYDKENKLTFTGLPEKYHLKQYLHFQMSGQVSQRILGAWSIPGLTIPRGHTLVKLLGSNSSTLKMSPLPRSATMNRSLESLRS